MRKSSAARLVALTATLVVLGAACTGGSDETSLTEKPSTSPPPEVAGEPGYRPLLVPDPLSSRGSSSTEVLPFRAPSEVAGDPDDGVTPVPNVTERPEVYHPFLRPSPPSLPQDH